MKKLDFTISKRNSLKEIFNKHNLIGRLADLETIKKTASTQANIAFTTWMLTILVIPLICAILVAVNYIESSALNVLLTYVLPIFLIALSSIMYMDSLTLKATKYYNKKLGYNYYYNQLVNLLKDSEVQKDSISYFNILESAIFSKEDNENFKTALAEANYDKVIIELNKLLPVIQEYHSRIEYNQSKQEKIQKLEKMLGVHKIEEEQEIELEHTNFKSLL